MVKKRLEVSVSGGRTSAYMAWWLKKHMSHRYEMAFVFANTGREHPDTLRFLEAANQAFGLRLVRVESVAHPGQRKGSTHEVVGHNSLNQDGAVFEAMIQKYGIPNHTFPHCTRELKANAIRSYMESVWEPGTYDIAIGIREDEKRRVTKSARMSNVVYPLIDWHPDQPDKAYILDWFKQFEWDLRIPEHLGNCVNCFKKTDPKLNAAWHDAPEYFEFTERMERKYGLVKPPQDPQPGRRVFFRGFRSTKIMVKMFKALGRPPLAMLSRPDESETCTDSCEPYPMERVS
jgi:hypothetical protein